MVAMSQDRAEYYSCHLSIVCGCPQCYPTLSSPSAPYPFIDFNSSYKSAQRGRAVASKVRGQLSENMLQLFWLEIKAELC